MPEEKPPGEAGRRLVSAKLTLAIAAVLVVGAALPVRVSFSETGSIGGASTAAAASPVSSGLTPLIPRCAPEAVSRGGCGDLDKPVWRRFVSDTGEVTKLDTASVQPAKGQGAIAYFYTYSPRSSFDPQRLRQVYFTCQGQYADLAAPGDLEDAPPRSVVGAVAAFACRLAEPKRQAIMKRNSQLQRQYDTEAHERAIHPRPEDYCKDFSADTCLRIQTDVDAPNKPAYCMPGWGTFSSGLTDEQRRVCAARAPKDDNS